MNRKTLKVIQAIHKSVPQEWRDAVVTLEFIAPDLRLEARKQAQELRMEADALPDGEEKKNVLREAERLQNVIDAGYYDAKEWRVNQEIAKKIDAFIEAEIDKAIAEGRIPHPKNDKEYQSFIRKLKQHEKRDQKSTLRRNAAGRSRVSD